MITPLKLIEQSRRYLLTIAYSLFYLAFTLSQELIEIQKQIGQSESNISLNIIDSDGDNNMELVSVANRRYIVIQDIETNGTLRNKWISDYIGVPDLSGSKVACLTVGNIDDDANVEILYFNFDGELKIIDGRTKEIEHQQSLRYPYPSRMEIYDLMGSGENQLIITSDNRIIVLDLKTFTELWSSPTLKPPYYIVADIDNDSTKKILFGRDSILAYDLGKDSIFTFFDRKSLSYNITDITGDGTLEAIITDESGLYIYDFPDFLLKSFRPGLYTHTEEMISADADGDGVNEFFLRDNSFIVAYDIENDKELWSQGYRTSPSLITDASSGSNLTIFYSDDENHIYHRDAYHGTLLWSNTIFKGPNFHFTTDFDGDGNLELGTMQNIHNDFYNQGSQIRIEKYRGNNQKEVVFSTHPTNPSGLIDRYTSIISGRFSDQMARDQIIYTKVDNIDTKLIMMDGGKKIREKSIGHTVFNALIRKGNLDSDSDYEIISAIRRQIQIFEIEDLKFVLKNSIDLHSPVGKLKLIDINYDGKDEIVLIEDTRNKLMILDPLSLEIIYENSDYNFRDFAWGDITGDHVNELVLNVSYPVEFVVLDSLESTIRELPLPSIRKGDIFEMTIAELDPNLKGEEVIVVYDSLFVFSLDTGNYQVTKGKFTGSSYYSTHLSTDINIIDFDEDGVTDILFGTQEGLYHYQYHPGKSTAITEGQPVVKHFRILQNPIRERLDIISVNDYPRKSRLILYDNSGQIVTEELLMNTYKNEIFTLSTALLPSGLYHLNIINEDESSCTTIIKL